MQGNKLIKFEMYAFEFITLLELLQEILDVIHYDDATKSYIVKEFFYEFDAEHYDRLNYLLLSLHSVYKLNKDPQ